jgi:hypothetical protein
MVLEAAKLRGEPSLAACSFQAPMFPKRSTEATSVESKGVLAMAAPPSPPMA